jgi:hypothetical protein
MVRSNAGVITAMLQNAHSNRSFAEMKFPGYSRRSDILLIDPDLTVAASIKATCP